MALAASGSLSMKASAGAGRDISAELYGASQNGSYSQFRTDANKTATGPISDFYSFNGTPADVTSPLAVDLAGVSADISWTNGTLADNHLQIDLYREENAGGFILRASNVTSVYNDAVTFGNTYTWRIRTRTKAGRITEVDTNTITAGA